MRRRLGHVIFRYIGVRLPLLRRQLLGHGFGHIIILP